MPENNAKQLKNFLGRKVLFYITNFVCRTLSFKITNKGIVNKLISEGEKPIVAFWHTKMLAGWYLHSGRNFAALVSPSKDGDILTNILNRWGYKVIRGSSSRGGKNALDVLTGDELSAHPIAITPDGPRGPAGEMKPGCVVAAKRTGRPLVLMGIDYGRKKVFQNSWDKFEFPYPFSKVHVIYSEPYYFSSDLSFEDVSQKISECESTLIELQNMAVVH